MRRAEGKPDPALQVESAPGPLPGGELLAERYLVGAELGRGVGGVVYRAFDQCAGVWVALKVLDPQRWSESRAAAQLYRELRFGRSLHHPHVCRLHDVFEADGRFFLVMELASRGTLRTTLQEPARALDVRLEDARAVIAGLSAIHRAGLVHRDLKPENVLRLDDGRLVISDFGLARALEQATATTSGLGTPGYLAPEILAGGKADQASDVWSLGVVLHEILAGCRPRWEGQRVRPRLFPKLTAKIAADPKRAALARTCEACLDPDPRQRPATAADVLTLLDATVQKALADRRLRWAIVASCLLAAIPAVRFLVSRAPGWLAPAREDRADLGEDWSRARLLLRPPWRENVTCWHAVGPDRRIVRVAHELAPPPTVVDIDLDSGQQRRAAVDPEAYLNGCPSVSPDGRALLFARRRGAATQVMYSPRPDGREAVPLVEGTHPTWLPSGKDLVFVTPKLGVALSDLHGHTQILALSEPAPAAVLQLTVDDRGDSLAARTRHSGPTGGSWLDLYDLRRRKHIRSAKLEVDSGRVEFDWKRKAFQVPTVEGGVRILAELSEAGALVPAGHIPGMSIQGASRLSGGRVISAVREGKNRIFLIRPDGTQQLIGTTSVVAWDISGLGTVLYSERPDDPTSDLSRLMVWRPGPPAGAEVLAQARGIGQPVIAEDGQSAVYRTSDRDLYHCDLSRPGTPDPCRLVHVDPGLHGVPVPGPIGHDGDAFPYFAVVSGEEGNDRTKVLRVLFLRSGGVLELGPVEATCPLVWASPRSLWLLRDGEPAWQELDLWSRHRTARTWPADPVSRCYTLPPGQRKTRFTLARESPSELRFLPD